MNSIDVTDVAGAPGSASLLVQHDGKAFMYDMGFGFCSEIMAEKTERILNGKKPDFIILTHSHYDHVMGSANLHERWANIPVIGGEYTQYIFTRPSAKKLMYEMDVNAAAEFGYESTPDYTEYLHIDKTVKDGEIIDICGLELETMYFPGHTKCSLGFYCRKTKTLFSSETLGVYGDNNVMPIMLTGYRQGIESLERASELETEHIVLPHHGQIDGKDKCREYFEIAGREFYGMRDNVIKLHNDGASDNEIIESIRRKYYNGHIEYVYPLKAFYLNTGYTVPLIIKEYCGES